MTTHIKEELRVAWKSKFGYDLDCVGTIYEEHIIWAAQWVMERCAEIVDSPDFYIKPREQRSRIIVELSKELSEP